MSGRRVFLGCIVLVASTQACTTKTNQRVQDKPVAKKAAPAKTLLEPLKPARYVLTEGMGVLYDERGAMSPISSPDFAVASGVRAVLHGGVIVEVGTSPEPLVGFYSLPPRLGGGYILWSDATTFRASSFLGKLEPIANAAAMGGVRPWFDSFILRTSIGLLEVDPKSSAVRRSELSRLSEAISVDGRVGIRIDALGYAELSTDAGKSFHDLSAEPIRRFLAPVVTAADQLRLNTALPDAQAYLVDAAGKLSVYDPWAVPPTRLEVGVPQMPAEEPAYTRRLAPSDLAQAVVLGAFAPGERIVSANEMAVRVFAARSGNFIHSQPLLGVSEGFSHCQPIVLGDDALVACTHPRGAHLLALQSSPTRVQLAATFPESRGFVSTGATRFAFRGRCGSQPPTVEDFLGRSAPETPASPPDPLAPPPEPEAFEPPPPPPADEAALCVRRTDGTWVEHRLTGEDALNLYAFVPGDNGHATAIVLRDPGKDKPVEDKPDGLHIIRLSAKKKLRAVAILPVTEPSESPPYRSIDKSVWLDEQDGSIHIWAPAVESREDEEQPDEPGAAPVLGALSGVRISRDGSVQIHAPPEGTKDMVVGGPYGFVRAESEAGAKYYETTDGGKTFVEVAGPGIGDLAESQGDTDPRGCSIVGCALGGGLVRLGWGGGAVATNPSTKTNDDDDWSAKVFDTASLLPKTSQQSFRCRLDNAPSSQDKPKDSPLAVSLRTFPGNDIGAVKDGKWSALVAAPFDPRPPYRVDFDHIERVDKVAGHTIPLLTSNASAPVSLILRVNDTLRFDLSPGPKRSPVQVSPDGYGEIAAQIDRDRYIIMEPRLSEVKLVRAGVVRSVVQLAQVPDVTRSTLTFARRAGSGDDVFAIAMVQGESGDILLADLDLGRGTAGPLRVVGNTRTLDTGASCARNPRDYRLITTGMFSVRIDGSEHRSGEFFGSGLVSVGSGRGCREAFEVGMGDGASLVVRMSGTDAAGFPAVLHEQGRATSARCVSE